MKCDNCGIEIKNLDAFCPHCGKQLIFGDITPYQGNDRDHELTYDGYYDDDDDVTMMGEDSTLLEHPQKGGQVISDDPDATVMGEDPIKKSTGPMICQLIPNNSGEILYKDSQHNNENDIELSRKEDNSADHQDASDLSEESTLVEHLQKAYQRNTDNPDATVMGEDPILDMWTCPECETRNEGSRKYCNCCGFDKQTIEEVVLPIDSVKDKRKNPIVFIALAVFVVLVIGVGIFAVTRNTEDTRSTVNPGDSTVDLGRAKIGDYVTFGHYEQDNNLENGKEPIEWKVLDKANGRALLLSKYGLDYKRYNEDFTAVTWETCTLRSWLNSTFLNEAFSSSEQSAIPTVKLSNQDNPNFGTEGGNNTNDQVFLLSLQEMQQYFNLSDTWTDYDGNNHGVTGHNWYLGGSKSVIISPTAYAIAQGMTTDTRNHDAEGREACWWWLRSPGMGAFYDAALVYGGGDVYASGSSVNDYDAVRPALWVELAS